MFLPRRNDHVFCLLRVDGHEVISSPIEYLVSRKLEYRKNTDRQTETVTERRERHANRQTETVRERRERHANRQTETVRERESRERER